MRPREEHPPDRAPGAVRQREIGCCWIRLPHAVSQSGFDCRARVQRAEHHDRSYRGAGEFRRDIFGDGGKTEHVYVQHLSIGSQPFEILTSVVAQTEFQALACDRLLSDRGMPLKQTADCGSNEIGAVGIKPFAHHKIDMPQVDEAEIDRNLLGIACF